MIQLEIYEPIYGAGAHSGRLMYVAAGRVRRGVRGTVEEEGGDVQVGREQVRVLFLDRRIRSGWYARLYGQWFRVAGVRPVPPYGVQGDLDLDPNADVRVIAPEPPHDLIWGADTPITWGGDTAIDWPGI